MDSTTTTANSLSEGHLPLLTQLLQSLAEPTSPTPIFTLQFCMHGSFTPQDKGTCFCPGLQVHSMCYVMLR